MDKDVEPKLRKQPAITIPETTEIYYFLHISGILQSLHEYWNLENRKRKLQKKIHDLPAGFLKFAAQDHVSSGRFKIELNDTSLTTVIF